MIVTCEKCSTQFKLDDARVPEQGVKVRCSRCKHAFHVERPPTGERRIARAVEHVLDGDTQELDGDDTRPGGEDSPFGDTFDHSADDPGEESDWEFNTEKPAAEPARQPEPAPRRPAPEPSMEDLLGDPPAPGESLSAPERDAGVAPERVTLPPPALAAELGSPEEWNFFTDDPDDEPPAPKPREGRVAIGQLGIAPTAERVVPPLGSGRASPRLGPWIGRALGLVGWVVVAGLVAGILARGAALSAPVTGVGPGVQALGAVEARAVEAHWLENAVAGRILVVSGELASRSGSRGDDWIAVRLLDRSGAVLDEDAGAVGPALSTLELREADPRELRAAQVGAALEMTRAAPGSRRRFHAVLHPVPAEAARFELVAVSRGERAPGSDPADGPEG